MLPKTDHPTENIDNDPPFDPRKAREEGRFMSLEDVQGRLIEAVQCTWRMPDREREWHAVKASWPDYRHHTGFGDHDAFGPPNAAAMPVQPKLTRKEMAEMEEAFAWLMAASEDDRRLIALAIRALAKGHERVPWMKLRRAMGVKRGADGLRMRYSRAMLKVCERANRRFGRNSVSRG
ncbi:hypothetical protein [Sphingomonas colocasiae]|nr:hypothetical protein [Sphingomonas colocasiae]